MQVVLFRVMKVYRGVQIYLHAFLPSALDGLSGLYQGSEALPPGQEPQYQLKSGLVGPKTSLDYLERRKISCPCWDSNPRLSNP